MSNSPILVAALAVSVLATPVAAAEQSYDLSGFTNVSVERGIEVTLTTGAPYQVTAETSRRSLMRRMQVSKRGDTLVISRTTGWSFFMMGTTDRYHVSVSMPTLEGLATTSGAEVEGVLGSGQQAELTVRAMSGSQVELSGLSVAALEVSVASGSQAELSGSCDAAEMKASSGAEIDGEGLNCVAAELRASSGAKIDLAVSGRLEGRVSSGGDIDIIGTPQVVSLRESSGGDVSVSN